MDVDLAEIDVVEEVGADRLAELMALYAAEWWTASRTSDEVAQMLHATDLVIGLVHRPSDRLVGFSRVLTDGEYVAVILDVIVAADCRQAGLGAVLLDTLVGHPRLAKVQSLELVCQAGLVPFYGRWGFTDQVGGSRLMRRTSDPRLIS